MITTTENSKRIAKNTLLLYLRMLFNMAISLYTSRIILQTLGVEDFGIYNVVGGVVLMFSFLNNAMTAAVQRYISFELGRGVSEKLNRIFSMSVNIHVILALIIILFAETIGLYVFYEYLKIPTERMTAALVVYQCALASFSITVLQVPFISCIVAHEKMNIFAIGSVSETSTKFLGAVILIYLSGDKLICYAIILLTVSILVALFYRIYTILHFSECHYKRVWDKPLCKEMLSYSSWSLFGGVATIASTQGINILLNIFFGPIINAARGVAYQVNAAVCSLYSSFMQAINPQIIKQYSIGNYEYMHQLIYNSCRLTYLLVLLLALPICLETEHILYLWLGQVPEHAVLFCRLVLVATLVECMSMPLVPAVQATGKIKKYQSVVGSILLMNLPLSYVVLKITYIPEASFYMVIVINGITAIARLLICRNLINLSLRHFFKEVVVRILLSSLGASVSFWILYCLPNMPYRFIVSLVIGFLLTILSIVVFGIKPEERKFVFCKLKKIYDKTFN